MKTFLLSLPLLSLALAETRTPFLQSLATTPNVLLFGRQLPSESPCPLGQSICDTRWCGEVCCNLGNGNFCPTGSYCDGFKGCCRNGNTCTGTPTCTSRSVPGCTLMLDCCDEDTPYCIVDEFGANICAASPGVSSDGGDEAGDSDGDGDGVGDGGIVPVPDLDDLFGEDEEPTRTLTRTSASTSSTATRSFADDDSDEATTTATTRPSLSTSTTPTATESDGSLPSDLDELFDRITSKVGDMFSSASTAESSSDLKDAIKDGLGEESDNAGVRQVVGMGVVVGLGAVLGGMVLM